MCLLYYLFFSDFLSFSIKKKSCKSSHFKHDHFNEKNSSTPQTCRSFRFYQPFLAIPDLADASPLSAFIALSILFLFMVLSPLLDTKILMGYLLCCFLRCLALTLPACAQPSARHTVATHGRSHDLLASSFLTQTPYLGSFLTQISFFFPSVCSGSKLLLIYSHIMSEKQCQIPDTLMAYHIAPWHT